MSLNTNQISIAVIVFITCAANIAQFVALCQNKRSIKLWKKCDNRVVRMDSCPSFVSSFDHVLNYKKIFNFAHFVVSYTLGIQSTITLRKLFDT